MTPISSEAVIAARVSLTGHHIAPQRTIACTSPWLPPWSARVAAGPGSESC